MYTDFLQQRMSLRRRKARRRRNLAKAIQMLVFVLVLVAFAPSIWHFFYSL